MSDPRDRHALLVGATGLVGRQALDAMLGDGWRVTTLARRALDRPHSPLWTERVCLPSEWPQRIAGTSPQLIVNALGTTWRAAGRQEAAFRAVDQTLVLAVADAAGQAGAAHCITVSSVGADAGARTFYLKVKGEVEEALTRIGFDRLDILRPGLLRGARGGERRLGERLGILVSPLTDLVVPSRYQSVAAQDVGSAIASLADVGDPGVFIHHNDAIARLIAPRG